ncbi:hypothetical protein AVEN_226330-1 [Araneus ventricosus]|uniref:Uncharacterized protein n=1 Tax=Araneus ventricosus TaxID=182803 RepID=A0A4Y2WBE9_ARAVE|nr:hypothetical protein AVEN_226330-1 [Araneus ventricosus]
MRSDLNAYRFLLLLVQGQSHIILSRAQIATSTHEHGESDEKEKRQAEVNKYRAQKIASSTHERGDSGFVGDAIIQTDRQSTLSRIWPKILYGPTFKMIKLCTKFHPSSSSSF